MNKKYIFDNIKIYDTKEIILSNGKRLCYLIECDYCHNKHYKAEYELLKGLKKNKKFFCNKRCFNSFYSTIKTVECAQCSKLFKKTPSQIKQTKNNFCSKSCAATFNNKNKKYGTRRSKIEIFLEEKIKICFPDIEFICNNKKIIGSELDFYFPMLKLAIQINGIVHSKPIYGQEKFDKIKILDEEKRTKCNLYDIKLYELDCSNDRYLNKKLKEIRWQQIKNVIEESSCIIY